MSKRIVIEVIDEDFESIMFNNKHANSMAIYSAGDTIEFEIVEDETQRLIDAAVEAERKRIRAALAGPLLETLRGIPRHQYLNGSRVVDGEATRGRMQRAWREAFPLTDEVAEHLREVLKEGQS